MRPILTSVGPAASRRTEALPGIGAGEARPAYTRTEPMSATILLVEDNEDNRTIYRTILQHGGYEVAEAGDGEAALRMARELIPALVLMDISIPLIDGWEATRRLKSDPATARIPVIALTAHAQDADRQRSLEAGCDGYLVKPIEPRAVLREVERFVSHDGDGNGSPPLPSPT